MLHQVTPQLNPSGRGNDNLAVILSELEDLTLFASTLIENLEASVAKTTSRIAEVSDRAEDIRKGKLAPSLETLRSSQNKRDFVKRQPEKKFKPTKGFDSSVADVFKPETRPAGLAALRASCNDAPDFTIFDNIVPASKCAEKFSFPGFFFQEWSRTEEAKNEQDERKLKEERDAKRRNREKKKRELGQPENSAGGNAGEQNQKTIPQEGGAPVPQKRPPRPQSAMAPSTSSNALVVTAGGPAGEPLRRPSRPLSTAVSTKDIDTMGSLPVPPARPARQDAPPDRPARRTSTVQPPPDASPSVAVTAAAAAPAPLPRPARPRTVNLPPTASLEPSLQRVPTAQPVAQVQQRPTPPIPVAKLDPSVATPMTNRPAPEPPVRQTDVESPRRAPLPPTPSPELVASVTVADSTEIEQQQPTPISTSTNPTRPVRRPRPPPPPAVPGVTQATESREGLSSGDQADGMEPRSPEKLQKTLSSGEVVRPKRSQAPPPPADVSPPMKRAPAPPPPASMALSEETEARYSPVISQPPSAMEGEEEELTPTSTMTSSATEDPALKKFVLMQKMNLPQGAIEQAMIRANVDPGLLYGANAMTKLGAPPLKLNVPPPQVRAAEPASPPRASGNAMMDEILKGKALRKVETPPSAGSPEAGTTATSDLMKGILSGRGNLRKVEKPEEAKKAPAAVGNLDGGGVASILARRIAIIGDKGSDTDSVGSEWDDSDED